MWFDYFSVANCKNCYACVRVCPVNAIEIKKLELSKKDVLSVISDSMPVLKNIKYYLQKFPQ